MSRKIYAILVTVLAVLFFASYSMFDYGKDKIETTMRDVTLVDTSSISYAHKRNTYFNTRGHFVDDITKAQFTASISDKLYREFEANGNKPIKMQREFSQQNLEGNMNGKFFHDIGILLIALVSIFMLVFSVMFTLAEKEKLNFNQFE